MALLSRYETACELKGLNKSEVMRRLMDEFASECSIHTTNDVTNVL